MPTIVHGYDWPDRVVVGTVGQPGSREFFFQARDGRRVTSIALEKQQSAALAEKIDEILDELMSVDGNPASIPASTPVELVDNDPLDQPVEAEFRLGTITLGWDPTTAQVVIEAYPVIQVEVEVNDDGEVDPELLSALAEEAENGEPPEVMLVRIPVGTARAFAKRTLEIVGAGRALCSRCGQPMDPEGHTCPPLDDLL